MVHQKHPHTDEQTCRENVGHSQEIYSRMQNTDRNLLLFNLPTTHSQQHRKHENQTGERALCSEEDFSKQKCLCAQKGEFSQNSWGFNFILCHGSRNRQISIAYEISKIGFVIVHLLNKNMQILKKTCIYPNKGGFSGVSKLTYLKKLQWKNVFKLNQLRD